MAPQSTQNMKNAIISEMPVNFYHITQYHAPKDSILRLQWTFQISLNGLLIVLVSMKMSLPNYDKTRFA
jgi:hypothetical protein